MLKDLGLETLPIKLGLILLTFQVAAQTPSGSTPDTGSKDSPSRRSSITQAPTNPQLPRYPTIKAMVEKRGEGYVHEVYNPSDFTKIDGAKTFSTSMMYFYTAEAVLGYYDCFVSQTEESCQAFLQSLKDPGTHIGFYLFTKMAYWTNSRTVVQRIEKNLGGIRFMGLAAGMLVNDAFSDIWTSQEFKDLRRNNQYIFTSYDLWLENRKALLKKLVTKTVANPEWLIKKLPAFTAMLMGGYMAGVSFRTSQILLNVARKNMSSRIVQLQDAGKTAEVIKMRRILSKTNSVHRLIKEFELIKGVRSIWKAGRLMRVNPVLFISGHVVETALFLKWTEWIQEPLEHTFDRTRKAMDLNSAIGEMFEVHSGDPLGWMRLNLPRTLIQNQGALMLKTDAVARAWDNLRTAELAAATRIFSLYASKISEFTAQYDEIAKYYNWLMTGADPQTVLRTSDGFPFVPSYSDMKPYLRGFFCGSAVTYSVQRAVSFLGMPLPFFSDDTVSPFRAINYSPDGSGEIASHANLCKTPPTGKPALDETFYQMRDEKNLRLLRERKLPNIETQGMLALTYVKNSLVAHTNEMAERYYNKVRSTFKRVFFGTPEGSIPRLTGQSEDPKKLMPFVYNVVGSFSQERHFWEKLDQKYGRSIPLFKEYAQRSRKNEQQTIEIMGEMLFPQRKATRSKIEDSIFGGEKEVPTDDVPKLLKEYRSLIIPMEETPAELDPNSSQATQIRQRKHRESLSGR